MVEIRNRAASSMIAPVIFRDPEQNDFSTYTLLQVPQPTVVFTEPGQPIRPRHHDTRRERHLRQLRALRPQTHRGPLRSPPRRRLRPRRRFLPRSVLRHFRNRRRLCQKFAGYHPTARPNLDLIRSRLSHFFFSYRLRPLGCFASTLGFKPLDEVGSEPADGE